MVKTGITNDGCTHMRMAVTDDNDKELNKRIATQEEDGRKCTSDNDLRNACKAFDPLALIAVLS